MRTQVLNEQSNDFPTASHTIAGFGTVNRRVLSHDPSTGEESSRIVVPAGHEVPRSHFTTNLELFVLRGSVRIGVHSMEEYTYGYIPAGIASGPWIFDAETEFLWMSDGNLEAVRGDDHLPEADHSQYVPAKDFEASSWQSPITPGFYPGALRKSLRTDPHDGSQTWILGVMPGQSDHRMEVHPVCEEGYILETSEPDNRNEGLYLFRSPHVYHGPYHNRHFILSLFRTRGGPLVTNYITPRGQTEASWQPDAAGIPQ